MKEALQVTARGGILYDASLVSKPSDDLFEREFWRSRALGAESTGGRGSVLFIRDGERCWVLRHYRRGGLIARISRDRYLWSGADSTRSFREWRLLAELKRLGLPVPAPVAARYQRNGLTYRADLITGVLPGARTLADAITGNELPAERWCAVGRTIAAFHAAGVRHADLNAHNILFTPDGAVHVLDFDRGRIVARGHWEQQVLARLQRSLLKIRRARQDVRFGEHQWQELLAGYGEPETGMIGHEEHERRK